MHEWQFENSSFSNIISIARAIGDNKVAHVFGSFGDVYFQTAIINEYNKNNEDAIHLMIDEKYKEFIEKTIQDIKVLVYYVESPKIHNLLTQNKILGEIKGLPIRLLPTIYPYIPELIYSGKLKYPDFIRTLIGSKVQGKIQSLENNEALKTEARNLLEKQKLPIGNTIMISCENNTHQEFKEEIWWEVIDIIEKRGFTVCINSSGTLSSKQRNLLNPKLKTMSIPPHLAVSIIEQCGGYIGTSNGLNGIQAYFNHTTYGIHLINASNGILNSTTDKFGNEVYPKLLGLEIIDPIEKSKKHEEIYVEYGRLTSENKDKINNLLKIISNNN